MSESLANPDIIKNHLLSLFAIIGPKGSERINAAEGAITSKVIRSGDALKCFLATMSFKSQTPLKIPSKIEL